MNSRNHIMGVSAAVFSVFVLASCGGGGDGTNLAPLKLKGVNAIGEPIADATIYISCANMTRTGLVNVQAKTDSQGVYEVVLDAQPPCRLLSSGGTTSQGANKKNFVSVAVGPGTANVTPLTELVTAVLIRQEPENGTPATPVTAVQEIKTDLSALSNLPDPITTPFSATAGDPQDNALEALAVLEKSGVTTNQLATALTSSNSAGSTVVQSANASLTASCAQLGGCGGPTPVTPSNPNDPNSSSNSSNPSTPTDPNAPIYSSPPSS